FQTMLDTYQELLSEPERPHPQRIDRDVIAVDQFLPVFNFRGLLSLIVLQDQLAVFSGESPEAALQTSDARLQLFEFIYVGLHVRQLAGPLPLSCPLFMDF